MTNYEVVFSLQAEALSVLEAKAQDLRDRLGEEREVDPEAALQLERIERILHRLQRDYQRSQRH